MAYYNRKQHLIDNINAIQRAFKLEKSGSKLTEEDLSILLKYCGFGGIKCVLKPCERPEDITSWNKSETDLFPYVQGMFNLIRYETRGENGEEEYKKYVDGIKSSVLTSFYTPDIIPQTIASTIQNLGIKANNFLDPSAGIGSFTHGFNSIVKGDFHLYENDPLTGKILKLLYPDDYVFIKGFEEIDTRYNNHFDLISSNIPFGNFPVFDKSFENSDDKIKKDSCSKIHNYYFIKSIDLAREGALIAFITSEGVMDSPSNREIRDYMMKNTDLVSAIRLPNNLFMSNSGIIIGSDLIILQKNTSKLQLSEREKQFVECRTYPNGVTLNNHFQNTDYIICTKAQLGTNSYGEPAMEFFYEGDSNQIAEQLSVKLSQDINTYLNIELYTTNSLEKRKEIEEQTQTKQKEKIPTLGDIFGLSLEEQTQINEKIATKSGKNQRRTDDSFLLSENPFDAIISTNNTREYKGDILHFYKPNTLIVDKGQIGYYDTVGNSGEDDYKILFKPTYFEGQHIARLKDYIPLRDSYKVLYDFEKEYQVKNESLRLDLNEQYNSFILKHGDLNSRENYRLLLLDSYGSEVLALESFENGKKKLADIFTQPVSFLNKKPEELNSYEALSYVLNQMGNIDLDLMSSLTSMDKKDIIEELEGHVYYNPLIQTYQAKTSFIAGNVIVKAEQIEEYIQNNPDADDLIESQFSLDALRMATPEKIPFADLDFNLGERWIPTKFYDEYITEIFSTNVKVDYNKDLDDFFVTVENDKTIEIDETYAIISKEKRKYDGLYMLDHALKNTTPNITYTEVIDRHEVTFADVDAINIANSKIEEIRQGFMDWLSKQHPNIKQEIETLYNRTFNARVIPEYDGKFQSFPDLQLSGIGVEKPYDSQYDTVWMLKCNNGGIVDHEVGTGKTLTICMASYEMLRLKMVNKAMILGLKSNVSAIAETYSKVYPNARVIHPSEKDFSPENRKKLFNNIANNNWDAVIITHDQFMKIPQPLHVQKKIYQDELDSIEENLRVYKNGKPATTRELKGLERRKKTLKKKLDKLDERLKNRRDDVMDFEKMGIDHLFIDESHYFKNLQYNTRFYRVSGLGNPQGSDRATNLLMAIRSIQMRKDSDLCATFLTGTTITNSLVESYLLFKYLRPKVMEEMGLRTFDAWAAVFAKKTVDLEFNVTNELKPKERFRYFKNVPELQKLYHEITDYRTAKGIQIDRPEPNIIFEINPATPEQLEFLPNLIKFNNTKDGKYVGREPLTKEEEQAIGLITTDYGKKMSLDMRLIDPVKYHDHPNNKASRAAKNIADYYFKYNEHKAVQFVFSDLGTYKPNKWNVFSEIKSKLVNEYNIPANEIRFIQECKSMKERQEFIENIKSGKIRVPMGATGNLGTGVDAPDKAVASHNLDVPWTPAGLTQRNGRSARKGNMVAKLYADNKVDIILYASENSLDTYKFNLLQNKQLFINQFKTNTLNVRTIDEGGLDEDGNMNFKEYVAILSGNPDLLEKLKIERKITVLQAELKSHNVNMSSTVWRLNDSLSSLNVKQNRFENLTDDWNYFNKIIPVGASGERINPIRLNGFGSQDEETIGNRLLEMNIKANTEGEFENIGKLSDFNIQIKTENNFGYQYNKFFIERNCKYSFNNGNLPNDPVNASRSFIQALEKIPVLINQYREDINKLKMEIPALEKIVKAPWKKAGELNSLIVEQKRLEKRIEDLANDNIKHKPVDNTNDNQLKIEDTVKPKNSPVNNTKNQSNSKKGVRM